MRLRRALLATSVALLLVPVVEVGQPGAGRLVLAGEGSTPRGGSADPVAVDEVLARTLVASRSVRHEGDLVVVTFGARGPRIGQLSVAFDDEGGRVAPSAPPPVGRPPEVGYLRSSATLLQLGGIEPVADQLARLRGKYVPTLGERVPLDTGDSLPVSLHERSTTVLREVLYVDADSGLLVRRETYDRAGAPFRVVAYTDLAVAGTDGEATRHSGATDGTDGSASGVRTSTVTGAGVPSTLPLGYELLRSSPVPGAPVPTLHLVYGDGIYAMSVFQQQGRMKPSAVASASELRTPEGGAVWAWPGSSPRRLVWNAGATTYTVLADPSVDELLEAIVGLPVDPPPSILERLDRGLDRILRWVLPSAATDRSDT